MLFLVLISLTILFFADAFSVLKLHQSKTGKDVLDYLEEDSGQPAAGFLYTLLGLGMVVLARHQGIALYYPLYGMGGWISLIGIRFFEPGFARRFYLGWVFHCNPWRRRMLFGLELACGIYLAFLTLLLIP